MMFARMFIAAIVLPVLLVGANPNPIAYGEWERRAFLAIKGGL